MNKGLYGALQGNRQPMPVNGMNGNILQRFQQFQRMFRGDPRQQIQQMLNSGQISQEQYNAAVQRAQQLQQMMRGINPGAQG